MALTGTLETFSALELLQIISSIGESGKLSLTQDTGQGLIVFRNGKIIYAASSSVRETLGNILAARGLLTQEQLDRALREQRESEIECRLGSILVDMGFLEQQRLEDIVREQLQKVISEFLHWTSGHFQFEPMNLLSCGEVEIEAKEYLLGEGMRPEHVLVQHFRRLAQQSEAEDAAKSEAAEPSAAPDSEVGSLKSVMLELRTPQFTGEIAWRILDYAKRLVTRGVLFKVNREGYTGLRQFGFTPPEGGSPDFVRDIKLPSTSSIFLREAIERKEMFKGPMADTEANHRLMEQLGGGWPAEALVAPLIVGGRVLLIFHGDNLPGSQPIGELDEFDLVLLHAGLAMEKQVLATKIKYLESRQGARASDPVTAAEP